MTFDDLYQSGYIALADAVDRYERQEDGTFIALFMLRLKSAFMEASGSRGKTSVLDPIRQICTQSLDAPLDGAEDMTLAKDEALTVTPLQQSRLHSVCNGGSSLLTSCIDKEYAKLSLLQKSVTVKQTKTAFWFGLSSLLLSISAILISLFSK